MKHRFGLAEDAQGAMLTALGAMGFRLLVSRQYLRFLKPGMKIPLLLASAMLVALGLATLIRAWRAPRYADHAPADAHAGHSHGAGMGPKVGWLLAAPLAVLLLVEPAPLGSYAANRQAMKTTKLEVSKNVQFEALPPPVNGRVEMTLTDFSERGLYDEKESLAGVPVRLVGFVNRDPMAPGGFFLTRFSIACCAADASPVQVVLHGNSGTWPDDTWLTVDGVWKPTVVNPGGDDIYRAELTVAHVTQMTSTPDPYE